ncbi:MAG: DEAD/DEAH box helicase [Proteobacteria bacterium]|nr:MAG: DEAD/DEAH box helicase [Pseudomonadota bacterium]
MSPLYQRLSQLEEPDADGLFELFLEWVLEDLEIDLYPAQEEAIVELLTDNHVILKTPTGSGKSLVAVAMHLHALARGERSFYTSPIKALVNEKFLDLCRIFGPARVGMMTGDGAVNRDAPILCCTAEILSNIALREGKDADAAYVVMDEFHYYADPERGVAWQIPLLLFEDSTFLLMSATLGDTRAIETCLEERTGKPVMVVASDERPVPLTFEYSEVPLHEAIENLATSGKAPIYLVNFTQRATAEQAQNLMSRNFSSKEDKKAIAKELVGARFDTPYGKDVQRYLKHGVGLHHGGLLPKYRLLVERLSRKGLLKVISGTDTLGVGVNIPIRTVVFTKLCKYDGTSTRILSVRDFKQIAGRAGRKGYDDEGFVVAQAPEHVIENKRLEAKSSNIRGRRKIVRRQPPKRGYVPWNADTFRRLVADAPEPLAPSFRIDHGMMLNLLQRPQDAYRKGGGYRRLIELIGLSHVHQGRKRRLRRRARRLFQALKRASIVRVEPAEYFRGQAVVVNEDLQVEFSLMQTLALFLVEALTALDPAHPDYALDVLTLCEAILESPRAILLRQMDKLKGELVAELKAAGVDYEDRMKRLEEVTWPKPRASFIYGLFDGFAEIHPWVEHDNIQPKSIMRDMYERYLSFNDYVRELGLERSEGVLLRYLSNGFKTLVQSVPESDRTDEVMDVIAFFRTALTRVDASLIAEWERLMYGGGGAAGPSVALDQLPPLDISQDTRSFQARVRAELHALVKALAEGDWEEAAASVRQAPDDAWEPDRFEAAMAPFLADYGRLIFDHGARLTDKTHIKPEGKHRWTVAQVLVDPEGDNLWAIHGAVDLSEDTAPSGPMITLDRVGT